MARNDQDEYFFDDSDIEHLDASESEGVVYDHETETVDSVDEDTVHVAEEELEEVSPFWLELKDKSIKLFNSNKRLVYLLLLVVVIYIIAEVMGFGIHRPKTHKHVTPAKPVAAVVKPAANATQHSAEAPPLPGFGSGFGAQDQSQTMSTQASAAVSAEVASLRSQLAEQAVTIHTLSQALKTHGAVAASAVTGSNQIATLQDRIDQLTSQLSAMHSQLKHLEKVKKDEQASVGSKQTYHVRAVEPGRAWLLGRDGSSITVSLSSKIPGYGKVTHIDDVAGVVSTESGRKIRFAP